MLQNYILKLYHAMELNDYSPIDTYKSLLSMWLVLTKVDVCDYNNSNRKEKKHRPFSVSETMKVNYRINSISYDFLSFEQDWKKMLLGLQNSINHYKIYFQILKRNNWPTSPESILSVCGLHISRYKAYDASLIGDREHKELCVIYHPCFVVTDENIDGRGFERKRSDCKVCNSYIVAKSKSNGKWNLLYKYNSLVTCDIFGSDHLAKYVNEDMTFTVEDFYNPQVIGHELCKLVCDKKRPKRVIC